MADFKNEKLGVADKALVTCGCAGHSIKFNLKQLREKISAIVDSKVVFDSELAETLLLEINIIDANADTVLEISDEGREALEQLKNEDQAE